MESNLLIITIIIWIFFIISVINLVICLNRGKIYCSIYEREMWENWKKVIRNCDTIKYKESFNYPRIEGLEFTLIVDGEVWGVECWTRNENNPEFHPHLGIFMPNGNILTEFDKYHYNIFINMLREKFDFFPL